MVERLNEEFLDRFDTLSTREAEVLQGICEGEGPASIAQRLSLNVKTVSTYRFRILEKLALSTNVALAIACERAGVWRAAS